MLDNRFHHLVVIAIDALRTSPALLLENNVLFPRAARLETELKDRVVI